jgi:hypothetical protein
VMTLLDEAKPGVGRNASQLDYLRFIARLNLWFAEKVEMQEQVRQLCDGATSSRNKDSLANEIVARCKRVVADLAPLRSEFARLWKLTNKPDGLDLLLDRYDRQSAYWQEKISEVERGDFWIDPEIESSWIYHPSLTPTVKDSGKTQTAYFRKEFNASIPLRSASLQLIGDTYARVWVNGNVIGEVFARRSNSLIAEIKRIKTFDISGLLTDSTNVIGVEARNYLDGGSAGVNIYCEFGRPDGSIVKIMSDTTWVVSDSVSTGWNSATFDDSRWIRPVVKPYPYTIIAPHFATGRSSRIEQ